LESPFKLTENIIASTKIRDLRCLANHQKASAPLIQQIDQARLRTITGLDGVGLAGGPFCGPFVWSPWVSPPFLAWLRLPCRRNAYCRKQDQC